MRDFRSSFITLVRLATLLLVLLVGASPAFAGTTFTVDTDGSAHDNDTSDNACAIAGGGCTLHAAIQQFNAMPADATNKIVFSIPIITLTESIPSLQKPMIIDGIFGAPRVEIVGAAGIGSFDIQTAAGGTTIQNLVIRNMGSDGISIVDGGNSVYNCYIGTDKTGLTAQPNNGDGISVTTSAANFNTLQTIASLASINPNNIGDVLDASKGNLISGNKQVGINIFAQHTVKTLVAHNLIGTDKTGNVALPNESHGVQISGDSFFNTIGPANIISGNKGNGVDISGQVMIPNTVIGNIIGPSSTLLLDLGNTGEGIKVDSTLYDINLVPEVAFIGGLSAASGNIIGYNHENGIHITGACQRVRVFGNFIGGAKDPGNTVIAMGNVKNGIRVTTNGQHVIGSSNPLGANIISANKFSGIELAAGAHETTIQGNIIGRDPFNLTDFGNTLDGITITNTGNNLIGGATTAEGNVIAGNGRNGVKVTTSGSGFANLISHNSIFRNNRSTNGVGIDLDHDPNGVDPTDNASPAQDPNTAYSNYAQNAPVILSAGNVTHYNPSNGSTTFQYTLETSANTPLTLEFYGSDSPGFQTHGEGQVFLGTVNVASDGAGNANGTQNISPPSAYDSRGKWVTMTVTPTNVINNRPGTAGSATGPANNTSEFSNAVLVPNPGVLQFSAPTYSQTENGVQATITVTRTGGSDGAVSIDYATSNGTATAGDYTSASGTLNWADADSASKTFNVPITDDTVYEGDETVNLTLTNPGGFAALGAQDTAVLTITENETKPTISISDVSLIENNAGVTLFNFTVTLSGQNAASTSVDYITNDGTALNSDTDYDGDSGTVIFPPLNTSKQISIVVHGDTKFEADETFTVDLSNPTSNATIADNQGLGTIVNDDGQPTISIDDPSVAEGNAGTTSLVYTVTLSNASYQPITVDFATANGTATLVDNDYVANSNTLTFTAGQTSKTINVTVNGDTNSEPNETVLVNLTNPSNATISDNQGVGTITNDDAPPPTFTINNVSQNETNAGTTTFSFTVTLANPPNATITVDATTADVGATTGDADYVFKTATLSFPVGTTSVPFDVTVTGDTKFEPNEDFRVNLTNPSGGAFVGGSGFGTGTIQNDDAQPTISINDVTLAEGNAGTTNFVFNVTLNNSSSSPISVDYAAAGNTATLGADFAASTGTLNFPGGTVGPQTVTVQVTGETMFEPDETFFVNLTNPVNATIADNQGLGTITNDDAQPTITISDFTSDEGNAGNTPFGFLVSLSNTSYQTITVDFAPADGTALVANSDYSPVGGTVTINPGVSGGLATVNVTGDATFEPDETFFVNLTNAVNATIADNQALGTIKNDDVATPTLTIDDVSHNEGNAGTTTYTFTVTLANPPNSTVTVDVATADGSATLANSDYASNSTTLSFPVGTTTQTFDVMVNGDATPEPDETFAVNLTNATAGTTIGKASGTGTIVNDDGGTPTLDVTPLAQAEGNAGTTNFTFVVTLTNPPNSTVTVDVNTADGTATTADNDYVTKTQTLSFPVGTTTQNFVVAVNGDTKLEPDEIFSVVMSNATAGVTTGNPGLGSILNDDTQPTVSISDVSQVEGNAGTSAFPFVITLSNASSQQISVDYDTSDGTATIANNDYQPDSGTVIFPPGSTSQPLNINVVGDVAVEPNETFNVNLLGTLGGATIADNLGVGTIINDDGSPTFSVNNVTQAEGNSGTSTFTFTVTLAPAAGTPTSVQVTAADTTATTADADYVANTQTLNFAAGATTQTFSVTVNGDTKFEPNETFAVNLSANTAGTLLGGNGVGTINNDDAQPTISIADVSGNEGTSGTTPFVFTLTLSNPSSLPITVNFATADGTATVAGGDYNSNSGMVTFPAGTTTQTITIQVDGDMTPEGSENFFVNLSGATNATIADAQGVGTIANAAAVAGPAGVPTLGAKELMLLALALAAAAIVIMRK